jgi:hypothetical protein
MPVYHKSNTKLGRGAVYDLNGSKLRYGASKGGLLYYWMLMSKLRRGWIDSAFPWTYGIVHFYFQHTEIDNKA